MLRDVFYNDSLWYGGHNYERALKNKDKALGREIVRSRTGKIVQILGLRVKTTEELTAVITKLQIPPPLPGVDVFDEPHYGWVVPIAVRATSGHSYGIKMKLAQG